MKQAVVQLVSWVARKRLTKHSKTMIFGVGFFAVAGFLLSTQFVHAVEVTFEGGVLASMTNNIVNGIILGAAQLFSILTSFILKLTMFFLRFFIELAGYNNFINAPAVIVGWFMVRDVANMLFIVGLLVIAFSTILGIEKYEWKKALGHLIIAAVLINFSRLLLGLVIDVSHIFMVAFLNAIQGAAGGNLIQMLNLDKIMSMSGGDLTFTGPNANAREDLRLDLFAASFAGFMFSVMAMLSIAAYAVVLLVRVLVLWMLIILSPLAFVLQAIPQAKSYATEFWGEFTKYVIVGPMAVFFLWLAFAAMGNGDIGNHIGIQGQSAGETRGLEQSRETQTVTLSEATRWDNLSAYFVAVGFLFMGLERVQKLGVKGGSLVGGAASFGGKVATIASGYAAGRWLTRKGGEGLKVGGIGLAKFGYRRSGAQEFVAQTGSRFGAWRSQNKENRAQFAKGLEKVNKAELEVGTGSRAKRFGRSLLASIVEPTERKDKRAADWRRGAELAQKRLEENLGTSSSEAGQFKQWQGRRASSIEGVSGSKKLEKEAAMEERAFKIHVDVEDSVSKFREANTVPGMTPEQQKQLDKKANKYRKGLVGNMSTDDKRMYALGKELAGDRAVIVAGTASGEQARETLDDAKKIAIARARDEILVGLEENPQFEALAESEIYERRQKRIDALNFREATSAGVQYGDRFRDRRAALGLAAGVAGMSEEQRREMARSGALAASAFISNLKKGSENGVSVYNEAASKAGFTDPVDADNIIGQQAKLLSVLLQRKVEEADVGAAFSEFQSIHGEQGANTILRQLEAGLNNSAADGAVNLSGLLYNKDVGSDGRIKYRLSDNVADAEYVSEMRQYLAEEVSKSLKSITGVGDLIDKSNIDVGTGRLADDLSDQAVKQFVDAFGNVQTNTQLNQRLKNDLQKKFLDNNGRVVDQAKVLFERMNKDNAKALLKKFASSEIDDQGNVAWL